MNEMLKQAMTKNNGILLMAVSIIMVLIMMIMIDWPANKSFMKSLNDGYIIIIEDTSGRCSRSHYISSYCDHTFFYFKNMVIIPAVLFLLGLYLKLNAKI